MPKKVSPKRTNTAKHKKNTKRQSPSSFSKRLKAAGFVKTKIIPIIAIVIFAAIGTYLLKFSSAATVRASACSRTDTNCIYGSKEGEISRLYKVLFNNYGDKGGITYWAGQYNTTIDEVGQHIMYSVYKDANKDQSASGFVDLMYQNVLGRPADTGGKQYWKDRLGSATPSNKDRARVAAEFTHMPESRNVIQKPLSDKLADYYIAATAPAPTPAPEPTSTQTAPAGSATITMDNVSTNSRLSQCGTNNECTYDSREGHIARIYWAMGKTVGDKNGIGYWLSKYTTTSNQVGAFMLDTDGGKSLRSMSANDFVNTLYSNFLGRSADASGRDYWAARIGSGSTNDRAKLILHFSALPEAKSYTRDNISNKLRSHFGTASTVSPEEQVGYKPAPSIGSTPTTAPVSAPIEKTVAPVKPALTAGCSADIQARPTLKQGQTHACAAYLQLLLNYRLGAGLPGTTYFGPQTNTAVRDYQSKFRLSVDGIVGVQTWTHLETNTVVSPGTTIASSGSSGGITSTRSTRTAPVTTLNTSDPAGYSQYPISMDLPVLTSSTNPIIMGPVLNTTTINTRPTRTSTYETQCFFNCPIKWRN